MLLLTLITAQDLDDLESNTYLAFGTPTTTSPPIMTPLNFLIGLKLILSGTTSSLAEGFLYPPSKGNVTALLLSSNGPELSNQGEARAHSMFEKVLW